MKAACLFLFMLFQSSIMAAPFLVSDADPTGAADKCVYQVGAATPVETPTVVTAPALTGACRIDAAVFPAGNTSMQIWFKSTLWNVESQKVPFAFTKPAANAPGPANIRIVP